MMSPGDAPTQGWTDAREAETVRLWADGFSASLIAEAIGGGLTRNAVIGKLHRMAAHKDEAGKPLHKIELGRQPDRTNVTEAAPRPAVAAKRSGNVNAGLGFKIARARKAGLSGAGGMEAVLGHAPADGVSAKQPMKFGDGFNRPEPTEADLEVLKGDAWAPLPGHVPVSLEARGDGCMWPLGEVGEPGFGYCGIGKRPGSGYCEHHHRRAYAGKPQPIKPPAEANVRRGPSAGDRRFSGAL